MEQSGETQIVGRQNPNSTQAGQEFLGRVVVTHVQGSPKGGDALCCVQGSEHPAFAGLCLQHDEGHIMESNSEPNTQPSVQAYIEKHPAVGCSLGLGMLVIAGSLLVSMCSGGNDDRPAPSSEYSAEDRQRQREAAEHDEAKYAAENNLKALLKDADSAKYEGVFLSRIEGGNLMLCGKVNSKNSFGAFVGFKRFIASPNPSAPTLVEGQRSGLGAAVDSSFAPAYAAVCSNPVERY